MKLILLLVLISPSLLASNGNEVGNGGDAVICANKSPELLDYFEKGKFSEDELEGENWYSIAADRIQKLSRLNKNLSRQYKKVLDGIHTRLKFIPNANFRDIKDSFEVYLPKGCQIKQAAIRQKSAVGAEEIHIAADIWSLLSVGHKAGLILHEIVYEHYIYLGEKNSIKAREFNRFLASSNIDTISKNDYKKFARKLDLAIDY